VNSASQKQLDAILGLEGHGFEVIRYREDRGRFTRLRELNEVPGLANNLPDDLESHPHVV
jgi:DNA uptake protein ComE-like DNA-binding protein